MSMNTTATPEPAANRRARVWRSRSTKCSSWQRSWAARHEVVEPLHGRSVTGFEVVVQGPIVESARWVVADLLQCRVRLEDAPVETDGHDADRGGIEDRPELTLARRQRSLGAFAVGDVDHDALPVGGTADRILDDGGLLAHPDDAAVARDHPVLGEEGREGAARLGIGGDHALGVLGVQDV